LDTSETGPEMSWMLCKEKKKKKWRTAVGLIMWKINNIKYSKRKKKEHPTYNRTNEG
jgi:hypothetical protein